MTARLRSFAGEVRVSVTTLTNCLPCNTSSVQGGSGERMRIGQVGEENCPGYLTYAQGTLVVAGPAGLLQLTSRTSNDPGT